MSSVAISFIIPVYNVEKYLPMCLDSILAQDTTDVEIICIEDGSTDGSKAILQRYDREYDAVVVLENDRNRGPSFSRNRGLKHAKGRYIHFVDSDDYLSEQLMPDLKGDAYRGDVDIITFNFYRVIEKTGKILTRPVHYEKDVEEMVISGAEIAEYISSAGLMVAVWTRIYRRAFLMDNGLTFVEDIYYEDIPFTLKSLMLSKSIKIVNKAYYYYRTREDSIMTMPPTLKHLEGMFLGYLDTLNFLKNQVLNEAMSDAAMVYLNKEFLQAMHSFILQNEGLEIQFEDRILQHQWEHFDYHLKPRRMKEGEECDFRSVIIYGTGLYGAWAFHEILKSDKEIIGFAETGSPSKQRYLTHKVKQIDHYEGLKDEVLVVIATSIMHYKAIIEKLNQLGFEHYKTYDELLGNTD